MKVKRLTTPQKRTKVSKSILDLMSKQDREKALAKARRRLAYQKGRKISPELYMVAEFGYYFGWEALLALRRGYTVEPVSGNKEIFTLEEAQVLLEGARKVWYSKLLEHGGMNVATNSFKSGSKSFDEAVRPYKERAEL